MYKLLLTLVVLLATIGHVTAQSDEWKTVSGGTLDYNCETVAALQQAIESNNADAYAEVATAPLTRTTEGEMQTVIEFFGSQMLLIAIVDGEYRTSTNEMLETAYTTCTNADTQSASNAAVDEGSFTVVANSNVNLRSCAGTDCAVVGQTSSGQLLTVVGQDGDWYEVQTANGTAYIASWLTTRGPDAVISTTEAYVDENTGCVVAFDIKRGDMDINLILAGDKRSNVFADLFRPNESTPLRVAGQLDKTFIDTGEPYIHQYYNWNVGWPLGNYQLEISLGDATSRLAWELETRGDYNIFVVCN